MTFYQELQLNQAGSKNLIRSCQGKKEKGKHIGIYVFKVLLTVVFCAGFVTLFTKIFGARNGVAGVAILLSLLAFRQVNLGFHVFQSAWVLMGIFALLAVVPHWANQVSPLGGFVINSSCILIFLILGCHNVILFNHATILLSYLLLYGNDVEGTAYYFRVVGLLAGGGLVSLCFYFKHRKQPQKRTVADVFREFKLDSTRSRWQVKLTLGISLSMLMGQLLGIPRTMWIGIAAMSVLQPFDVDRKTKMKYRFLGNLAGSFCFYLLVMILPKSSYGMIGILGGIGVGFCATYKWQTVFNVFGAAAMAMTLYGIGGAITLRILTNAFAILFVAFFSPVFDLFITWIGNRKQTAQSCL